MSKLFSEGLERGKVIKLSNYVEIICDQGFTQWGWRFSRSNRPDKTLYPQRDLALKAAAELLRKLSFCSDVIVDHPPETVVGQSALALLIRGEKRHRAGAHGYSGGDGFIRL